MGYKPNKNGASSNWVSTHLLIHGRGQHHFYLSLYWSDELLCVCWQSRKCWLTYCTLTTRRLGFYPEYLWVGKTLTVQRVEHFLYCSAVRRGISCSLNIAQLMSTGYRESLRSPHCKLVSVWEYVTKSKFCFYLWCSRFPSIFSCVGILFSPNSFVWCGAY